MTPIIIGGFNYASGLTLQELDELITQRKEWLTQAHKDYNYCKTVSRKKCKERSGGRTKGSVYDNLKALERDITNLTVQRDELVGVTKTALQLETEREKEDAAANVRGAAQVKKYGLFAGIATALGLLVFITIKKFR